MALNKSTISISNNDKSFFEKELLNESRDNLNFPNNSSVENDFKK